MKNRLLKVISIFACLNLFACATTKLVNGPDGTPHQLVNCSFIESCYEDAAKACSGKYKIVNTSNRVSGDDKRTSSITSLLVKCEN